MPVNAGSDTDALCTSHVLCSVCQSIKRKSAILQRKSFDPSVEETCDHYDSLHELNESAKAGCHLCSLFLASIVDGDPEDRQPSSGDGTKSNPANQTQAYFEESLDNLLADNVVDKLKVRCWYDQDAKEDSAVLANRKVFKPHGKLCSLSISSSTDQRSKPLVGHTSAVSISMKSGIRRIVSTINDNDPIVNEAHTSELTMTTQSSHCIDLAKTWIESCQASHTYCRTNPEALYPARLIEVIDSGGQQLARLVATKSLDVNSHYAALSYCWGGVSTTTLKEASVESMHKGIDESVLAQTIRDALDITRRLGIRYIWIDSLCIVQDSTQDWKDESVKMGQIYRNARLTIAATGAEKSTVGCYLAKNPLSYVPCMLYGTPKDGVVVVRWRHYKHAQNMLVSNLDKAPLNTRAWVVQERLLSPRILHFTARGLYWECYEKQAYESVPEGIAVKSGLRWSIRELMKPKQGKDRNLIQQMGNAFLSIGEEITGTQASLEIPKGKHTDARVAAFFKSWHLILQIYTTCDMSFESDRYPGLRGITQQLEQITGLKTAESLWTGPFYEYLPYELMWYSGRNASKAKELRSASWSWVAMNGTTLYHEYGETHKPRISIITIQELAPPAAAEVDSGDMGFSRIQLRGKLYAIKPKQLEELRFLPDPKNEPYAAQLYLLLVIQQQSISLIMDKMRQYCSGLVLEKASGSEEKSVYERVGCFDESQNKLDERYMSELFEHCQEEELILQ